MNRNDVTKIRRKEKKDHFFDKTKRINEKKKRKFLHFLYQNVKFKMAITKPTKVLYTK